MTAPIVRPIPYMDESPGSILLRASSLNGWKSVRYFLTYNTGRTSFNSIIALFKNTELWKDVTKQLGIRDHRSLPASYKLAGFSNQGPLMFMGHPIHYSYLRFRKPAICPKCIDELGYIPKLWDYSLINICTKHKVLLTNTCNHCGKAISWNRQGLIICKCGSKIPPGVKVKKGIKAAKCFEKILENDNHEELLLIQETYSLLKGFFETWEIQLPKNFTYLKLSLGIVESSPNIVTKFHSICQTLANQKGIHPRVSLFTLLSSKKTKIRNFVRSVLIKFDSKTINYSKKIFSTSKTITKLQASFILGVSDHITVRLIQNNVLDHNPESRPMWKVKVESINKLLIKLNQPSIEMNQPQNFVSIAHNYTNQALRMKMHEILQKILTNEIEHKNFKISEGIDSLFVNVVKKIKKNNDYYTLSKAAKICNINYAYLKHVINIGLIKRVTTYKTTNRLVYVYKHSVNQFNQKYVSGSAFARSIGMPFNNIARKLMGLGCKPVSGPGVDKGNVYIFKRTDLNDLTKESILNSREPVRKKHFIKDESSMLLTEASRTLGVSYSKISHLIKHGLLIEKNVSISQRVIDTKSFDDFVLKLNNKSMISLDDAMKSTSETKNEFYRRWVHTGFVSMIDLVLNKFITKKDLYKIKGFKNEFVTVIEAAKISNTNKCYISNCIRLKKLKVSKTLLNNSGNVRFIHIDDVEALIRQ